MPQSKFFGYLVVERQMKRGLRVDGEWSVYIKVWFEPIFPLFPARLQKQTEVPVYTWQVGWVRSPRTVLLAKLFL